MHCCYGRATTCWSVQKEGEMSFIAAVAIPSVSTDARLES